MDLGDELRSRRYRRLLELIEELPSACRWRAAAQKDPDYLAQLEDKLRDELDQPYTPDDDPPSWHPDYSEFTLIHLQNNKIISLLGSISQLLGSKLDPEDIEFPTPLDPYEVTRDRLMEERKTVKVNKAMGSLLASMLKP